MQDNKVDYALLVLRIVLAIIFLVHGIDKWMNLAGRAGFFGTLGIPMPDIAVIFVAAVETLGGLALLLGVGTLISSVVLIIEMLVVIAIYKFSRGFINGGAELEVMIIGGLAALAIAGAGKYALLKRRAFVMPARSQGSTG